jgi:MFS superfamily sulfate permease-like transporter
MTSKSKIKSDNLTIKTGTNLTIENISDIYYKFLDGLNNHKEITIESGKIEEIDLTGIQFLSYLKKWAETKHKQINLNLKFTDDASQLITSSGFSFLLNP